MSREERKRVLVTGGSRGLGLAIVRDLLAAGYGVGTCSRQLSEPLRELLEQKRNLYGEQCAIGDETEEERFFRGFLQWSGGAAYYGLVNNAGIAGEGLLAALPNSELTRTVSVNLLAAVRLSKLSLQVFLERPGPARMVNISSVLAVRGATGLSAYSISKAGLDGLTRSLAREAGRREITVNSVNPGYLETDMTASLDAVQRERIVRRTPLGRLGKVGGSVSAQPRGRLHHRPVHPGGRWNFGVRQYTLSPVTP